MSCILIIDTAGSVTSVSLINEGSLVAFREEKQPNKAAELLAIFVEEILQEAHLKFNDLKAIAISKGPGSYTGLRISTSYAKGLCFSLSIPLISFSTLQSLAFSFLYKNKIQENDILIPMIDARREEAYYGIYDYQGNPFVQDNNIVAHQNMWEEFSDKNVFYFGNGADKFQKYLLQNYFVLKENFEINPEAIADFLNQKFNKKEFEDLAYFEPNYIKEFHFTVQKKGNI